MRYYLILLLLSLLPLSLVAQNRSNPFEITDRLPKSGQVLPADQIYSPFDVRPAGISKNNGVKQKNARKSSGPIIIQSVDPDKGKMSLLIVNLMLMLILSVIWVLYGKLFRQCLRATANSSMMKQLYTRRSGGELSALWVGYIFFNFALGFFLYLLVRQFDAVPTQGVWSNWLLFTAIVAGFTGLKQWMLWIYARLFPVRKEVSYYAFIVMVFCILTGLFLVPVNLLVSYAPVEWQSVFLYGATLLLLGLYGFHLIRGGIIARQYLVRRPVHIMLYICAVEIAPLLLIYRYLTESIAFT